MKAVSIRQPWAGAAVFGRSELLNLGFRTRYRGRLLIHAGGVDIRVQGDTGARNRLASPYCRERNALIGVVELTGCTPADDCQLPFAIGPNVWLITDPLVLPEPIPWPRFKGFENIIDAEVFDAVDNAMEPRDWERKRRPAIPEGAEVYPRRPGGWVGD